MTSLATLKLTNLEDINLSFLGPNSKLRALLNHATLKLPNSGTYSTQNSTIGFKIGAITLKGTSTDMPINEMKQFFGDHDMWEESFEHLRYFRLGFRQGKRTLKVADRTQETLFDSQQAGVDELFTYRGIYSETDMRQFFEESRIRGFKETRIDWTFDDYDNLIPFDLLNSFVKDTVKMSQMVKGRLKWRNASDAHSTTIYIGGKNSDFVVRIYKKHNDENGSFTRWEITSRGLASQEMTTLFMDKGVAGLMEYMVSKVDFVEPGSQINKARLPRQAWYDKLVNSAKSIQVKRGIKIPDQREIQALGAIQTLVDRMKKLGYPGLDEDNIKAIEGTLAIAMKQIKQYRAKHGSESLN